MINVDQRLRSQIKWRRYIGWMVLGAFGSIVIWIILSFLIYPRVDRSKVHPVIADLPGPVICSFREEIGISIVRFENKAGSAVGVAHFQPLGELDVLPSGDLISGRLVDEQKYPHTRRAVVRLIDRSRRVGYDEVYVMFRISTNPFDRTRAIIRELSRALMIEITNRIP